MENTNKLILEKLQKLSNNFDSTKNTKASKDILDNMIINLEEKIEQNEIMNEYRERCSTNEILSDFSEDLDSICLIQEYEKE